MPKNYSQNRRLGPDLLIKTVHVIGIVCFCMIISSMLLVDKAKPRIETFFDRLFGVTLRQGWDDGLLEANFYVLLITCCLSTIGLFFNTQRLRRKADQLNKTLVVTSILSFAGIIAHTLLAR